MLISNTYIADNSCPARI